MKQTFKFLTLSRVLNDCRDSVGRLSTLFLLLALSFGFTQQAWARRIFLDENGKWDKDNATIYITAWDGWNETVKMTKMSGTVWYVDIHDEAKSFNFLRKDQKGESQWGYTGNQTVNGMGTNNLYTLTSYSDGYSNGSWSKMIPIFGGTFYFDDSKTKWGDATLLIGKDGYTNQYGTTLISNTQIRYSDRSAWGGATFIAFMKCSGWSGTNWDYNNVKNCSEGYTGAYTSDYTFNVNSLNLFTCEGTGKTLNVTYQSSYENLNKKQSVEIWVSTDGGSTYSKQTSSLSTYGSVKATYYYMSGAHETTQNSNKDIVANSHNAVITSTMSLSATAATGYTLKGYSTSSSSAPTATDTSKPYTYTISDETTTRVYFALQSHNITYAENSDIASYPDKPATGYYGSTITVTATATANHVITGASTNVAGVTPTFTSGQNTQTATVKFTMPASDIELTLVTALGKVNLNFGAGEHGSLKAEIGEDTQTTGSQINGGSVVDFTATPNPGYQVEGWYRDSEFNIKIDDSKETTRQVTANADVNVYVKFEPITYSITYKETHDVTHSNPNTYTIETETITFAPPTSNRTGYDFAGWSPATIDKGSYGNKTITATWTAHTYSVHFDANSTEGIAGSMEDQTGFTYDVYKTLTACNFTKQGYTFAGWATTAQGNVAYSNQASVKNLTAEDNATVTLYAKWTPVDFTLSLTSNQKDSHNIHQIQQGSSTPITLTTTVTLGGNPYTLDLSHFDYTYQLVGGEDAPTAISTQTTNSTTWSAPTKVGHYTLTVSYNDGTITNKSASIDFVVWDEYTFYVWETGQNLNTAEQNANKVHVYHKINSSYEKADYSETTWSESGLRTLTDLSAQWGGGWHSFTIKYPLYNFFIIGYNAYNDNQYQSDAYYLSKEPSAKDTYLRCYYHSSSKWTWGEHSISEPTKPTIEITEVKTYSSIIKVTIKYNPHYSHITEHSLTINGQEKTLDGFDDTDEKEYTLTLTDLTARTDYNFVASARNAIDNEEVSKTITTPAANKVRITARKAKSHAWTAMGFYAWSSATEGKLFNDMSDYNLSGVESGDYWVYTFELPDSPAKFYLTNGSSTQGMNRTQDIETTTDVCVTVIDGDWGGNRGYNHNSYCGAHYQLSFTNNSGVTTYSNIIDSPDDIMSLYVGKTGDGTLKLRHYDAAKDEIVDYITTGFTLPASANVYNVSLKDVSDFDNITIANLGDFVPYIGKYYIRTDAATGGWQEYLFADKDNAMTQFTPRSDKGEDYSYYWVKNVAKTGTVRVSACVGNDYNPDLANMLKVDKFVHEGADGHGYIYQLTNGANVRFSYEPTTNEFKRAVIGGSGANDFLNVYSNDNNVYATKNGETLSDLLDDTKKEAQISKFNDVSDWVYEKVVYVKVESSFSAASVILQSKFNSQTNYLLGYVSDGTTPKPLEVLGAGTNPDTYIIRITYDYKKNRLMASWEPGSMDISANQSINTDILFIQREDANGAIDDVDVAQITYTDAGISADAKLTSLKNIIYVLEVTQKVMEGVAIDNQEYWITLPFDCRISDVFGVEDYVKLDANGNAISGTWGIMRYDGATRASHGWFLDDYSTFWRWMTRDETMNAGEGYVVIFDKTNASSWPSINVDGTEKQVKRLYFPSSGTGFTVSYSKENSSVTYTNNPCTVQKRGDQDSNWKVLGPKSYNNIDVDNAVANNLTYYYTYNQANDKGSKYVKHSVATEPTLKSFHSYMAQFGGDLTWKPFTKSDLNQAPLFAAIEQTFKGGMLTIELVQNNEQLDRTFVNLHKNGTTGFDNNMELVSISENCAQISTISEGIEYAGTTLPLNTELVPLNVKVTAKGTYDIALSESLNGLEVNLYDAFEQTTTPLDMMSATVTLNKGEYKDRFYLQLKQKSGETPTSFEGKIEQYNLPTDKTKKLLINDQIYLINGGRVYNVLGVEE